MATKKGDQLTSDINFIKTPAAKPAEFETGEDCGIALTNVSYVAEHQHLRCCYCYNCSVHG